MKKITVLQSIDFFKKSIEVEGLSSATIKSYLTDMNMFYAFVKEVLNNNVRYICDLRYHHLEQYKEYLRSKYEMRTSARKYNCFRKYIKKMCASGFIDKDIVLAINNDNFGNSRRDKNCAFATIRKQILSKETLNVILNRIKEDTSKNKYRNFALFHILCLGQRREDILSLKWTDLNFTEKTMNIYRKKTNTFDIVQIPNSAVESLKQLYKIDMLTQSLTQYVFNLCKNSYNSVIQKYTNGLMTETGDNEITGHTFRHTFVTHMIRAGVDLSIIRQYTGQSLETIQIYTHLSVRDSHKAVAVLNNLF